MVCFIIIRATKRGEGEGEGEWGGGKGKDTGKGKGNLLHICTLHLPHDAIDAVLYSAELYHRHCEGSRCHRNGMTGGSAIFAWWKSCFPLAFRLRSTRWKNTPPPG